MTTLNNILNAHNQTKYATDTGRKNHTKLRHIHFDGTNWHGDETTINKIKKQPELLRFFTQNSRSEVPIAGHINGRFISRRIDRLVINDENKNILILDYKSDIDKDINREQYFHQINEYRQLLHQIYPKYKISGYILWLHDFVLEKII